MRCVYLRCIPEINHIIFEFGFLGFCFVGGVFYYDVYARVFGRVYRHEILFLFDWTIFAIWLLFDLVVLNQIENYTKEKKKSSI